MSEMSNISEYSLTVSERYFPDAFPEEKSDDSRGHVFMTFASNAAVNADKNPHGIIDQLHFNCYGRGRMTPMVRIGVNDSDLSFQTHVNPY